ncbi:MAG: DUF58 domain-containing protein [Nitrospirota bacterium]
MLPLEILRKIKKLEIKTARLVEGALAGSYLSTFKGRGIEFTEVREYAEGDDIRSIDWNVTARTGIPHVKTFMEERDLTVMLAVDLSGSMGFGTTGQSKRELAVDFCAAASLLAVKNSDRVGLMAFTDKIELFIPPRKGKKNVMRLLTALSALITSGKGTDATMASEYLRKMLKSRATLFWVSDFGDGDYAGGDILRALKALSRRHELVPVVLKDRRETELPGVGLMELVDPETGLTAVIDTSSPRFMGAYKKCVDEARAYRENLFRTLRSEPIQLFTGSSPITPLTRYFRRKARLGRH